MQNDVIFSVFDHKKGPVILYSSLESLEDAKTVAVRSFIAIGAMEEKEDLSGKHAVVPLPALNKIAFYHMFGVNKKETQDGSSAWATIGYVSDSTESINFYRSLPVLQENIQRIVDFIQKAFTYSNQDTGLEDVVIKTLASLHSTIQETKAEEVTTPTPTITPVKDTQEIVSEDFEVGDLAFLFEYLSEDLDKVIYSLLLEEPVILIGDIRDIMQKVIASLEFIVPHRLLTKQYLTSYIDPKDKNLLIGSSHVNFLKKYKNYTNIYVDQRRITSKIKGVPSITNLLNTLKIAPKGTQRTVIRTYIDNLLTKAAQLMELCEKEQVAIDEIRNFRGELKGDELNVVIAMVRKYAPHFEGKLFHFARSMV